MKRVKTSDKGLKDQARPHGRAKQEVKVRPGGVSQMLSYLFHYLNTLSENSMNLPVFHWFRVIGLWAAGGCAVVWFATSRWGMDAPMAGIDYYRWLDGAIRPCGLGHRLAGRHTRSATLTVSRSTLNRK